MRKGMKATVEIMATDQLARDVEPLEGELREGARQFSYRNGMGRYETDRAALRADLIESGIVAVDCEYDGYNDDGEVGEPEFHPTPEEVVAAMIEKTGTKGVTPVMIARSIQDARKAQFSARTEDLVWLTAQRANPSFQNAGALHHGAKGKFRWNIPEDEISLRHTTEAYFHVTAKYEGL